MTEEEAKKRILKFMSEKVPAKTEFSFNDLYSQIDGLVTPRKAMVLIRQLVEEGKLEYCSSGDTTLIKLKLSGEQNHKNVPREAREE